MADIDLGTAELVIRIGADVQVTSEADSEGPPVVSIRAGGVWEVLFFPYSWSEGGEPTMQDAELASDLVMAFSRYRNAIVERVRANQSQTAARTTRRGRRGSTDAPATAAE
ncbi:hypothetical protein AB0M47_42365 [Hamadaea sp. NPDC051192]|uniref:hypothetical protein n=1 Tax=Hamadaea sp. NPDC051192 TaxID=3154940 RepID=UPI003414EE21